MFTVAALLVLANPVAGQWSLKDGSKVSFVFVLPSEKQAWRPDGSSIDIHSIPSPGFPIWTGKETNPILVALVNPAHEWSFAPSVRFKLPATVQLDTAFTLLCTNQKNWISGYKPDTDQPAEQDVAVGVAEGPWHTSGWVNFGAAGHSVKQGGASFKFKVKDEVTYIHNRSSNKPISTSAAKEEAVVTVASLADYKSVSVRLIAIDRKGKEMRSDGVVPKVESNGGSAYYFLGTAADLARVELQTRPFEWHTIRVAHFRPK